MERLMRLWSRFRSAVIACAAVFAAAFLGGFAGSLPMISALTALLPEGALAVQSYVGELLMARLLVAAMVGAWPAALLALWFALRAVTDRPSSWGEGRPNGDVAHAVSGASPRPTGFVVFAGVLFLCGGGFAYWVLLPKAIAMLVAMGGGGFALNLTVMGYVAFCCTFVVLCGALFNLPLLVRALNRLGLVNAEKLRRGRKKALLLALIAMAVLTPTQDAVTLLIAMAPLVLLYELSVLQLLVMEKRHG